MKYYILLILTVLLLACAKSNKAIVKTPTTANTPKTQSAKKPKNIIFLIGDGMGLTQITAGMYANNNFLNLERAQYIGLHKCHAADTLITDSAAGATAFACGKKTYNGAIGVGTNKKPLKTIIEYAEEANINTGLVATSTIVHATPASFIAHEKKRNRYEEIAADFLDVDVDIVIGGGKKYFVNRKDGKNLINDLIKKGYKYTDDVSDININEEKYYCLPAMDHFQSLEAGRDNFLIKATDKAINFLHNKEEPFFLMIESSQIDWGGHANLSNYIITEMIEFDKTIKMAFDYADKDGETLVIVTADHETGGYAINGGYTNGDTLITAFTSKYHTADMIPVFSYGPGAENFAGIYENTEIFSKMMNALNLKKNVED